MRIEELAGWSFSQGWRWRGSWRARCRRPPGTCRPSPGACRPSSTPPCPGAPGAARPGRTRPDLQRGSLGQDRRDRHQHGQRPGTTVVVVTQPIYVSPGRCWYPGHWTYEWVPQWTAYNAWVDQQVSPDGDWIGGYYDAEVPLGQLSAVLGRGLLRRLLVPRRQRQGSVSTRHVSE